MWVWLEQGLSASQNIVQNRRVLFSRSLLLQVRGFVLWWNYNAGRNCKEVCRNNSVANGLVASFEIVLRLVGLFSYCA